MSDTSRRRVGSAAVALAALGLLVTTVLTLFLAPAPAPDRVQELSRQLRCPVCKSVSIADSPSETAVAMRQAVTEQVAAGRSDTEIVDFFRARYGDWVLLDPPAGGSTLALWLVPIAVAALGVALVLARVRRRADVAVDVLPEHARQRVEAAVARARAAGSDGGLEP